MITLCEMKRISVHSAPWIFTFIFHPVVLFFFNCLTPNVVSSSSFTHYQDIRALMDLFDTTHGSSWLWRSNETLYGLAWNFSITSNGSLVHDPCIEPWQGVKVEQLISSDPCRVSSLSLASFGLYGSLPASLDKLVALKVMNFDTNSLTGLIPPDIGRLTNLTDVNLRANYLEGSIPPEFASLNKLSNFVISVNFLTQSIPVDLSRLSNLEILRFGSNYLTGVFPMHIFLHWSQLSYLSISGNQLTGSMSSELGNITTLSYIGLYNNQLSGSIPPELAKLTRLDNLLINDNWLTGTLPEEFGSSLKKLKLFWPNDNLIHGTIPSSYGGLTSLEILYLWNSSFTGTIPSEIGNLTNLVDFRAQENELVGSIPASFSNLEKLTCLYLYQNKLTGSLPYELHHLTGMVDLDLSVNRLTGRFQEVFGSWRRLRTLELHSNVLSGPFPNVHYPMLMWCFLQGNQLTGPLGHVFYDSKLYDQLIHIDFSDNLFSGPLPEKLFQIYSLSTIALSNNCFTGKLPASMCDAHHVQVLSMDGLGAASNCKNNFKVFFTKVPFFNYFGGGIPACVWGMSNLTTLHLTANGFTGRLSDVSSQSGLVNLHLAHNRLSGTIPKSIQEKSFLELDLSFNKITGEYSQVLVQSNQSRISLNVNRLSGKLPVSGVVKASELDILLGNMFTCGYIPQNDKNYEDYVCGSQILNTSLNVLGVFTSAMTFAWLVVACVCCCRGPSLSDSAQVTKGYDFQETGFINRFLTFASNQYTYFSFLHKQRLLPAPQTECITRFSFELLTITKCWLLLCGISIVISIPMYVLKEVSRDTTTHEYEYGWQLSWVYTTGSLSAFLLLAAWFCLIWCFILIIVHILSKFNTGREIERQRSERDKAEPLSRAVHRNANALNDYLELLNTKTIILLLLNNAAVIGINVLYIYSTSEPFFTGHRLYIQLLVAFFKQMNNVFVVPYLCKPIKDPERALEVRLKISILQSLIVPCLVTAFEEPNCLKGVFAPANEVSSSYSYKDCIDTFYSAGVTTCHKYAVAHVDVAPITPPFIYQWQCASVLLSAYIPVFIYTHVFQFGYPIMLIMFTFVRYLNLPFWTRAKLPGILWPDNWLQESPDVFSAEEVLMNKSVIARAKRMLNTKTVISYFANSALILLTFGLCSPYLALAIMASTIFTSAAWLMLIGRFVHYRLHGVPSYEDYSLIALSQQVREATGMLKVCVWPITISSSVFFAFICWDMAGDELGVVRAILLPCVAVCTPLIIWAMIRVYEWKTGQKIFRLKTARVTKRKSLLSQVLSRGSFKNASVEMNNYDFTSEEQPSRSFSVSSNRFGERRISMEGFAPKLSFVPNAAKEMTRSKESSASPVDREASRGRWNSFSGNIMSPMHGRSKEVLSNNNNNNNNNIYSSNTLSRQSNISVI